MSFSSIQFFLLLTLHIIKLFNRVSTGHKNNNNIVHTNDNNNNIYSCPLLLSISDICHQYIYEVYIHITQTHRDREETTYTHRGRSVSFHNHKHHLGCKHIILFQYEFNMCVHHHLKMPHLSQ